MSVTVPVADDALPADVTAVERDRIRSGRKVCGAATPSSRGRLLGVEHVRRADEAGHERRGRMVVDLARRADLLDATVVEHRDTSAHRQRLTLVVGDEHERDADVVLDRLQLDLHLLAELEVERAERLVEQQHLGRLTSARASATRWRWPPESWFGRRLPNSAEANRLEHLAGAPASLGLPTPFTLRPYSTFSLHGHVREQRVVLEDGVDVAVVRRDVGDVLAAEQDRAGRRLLEAGDHAQHRRLAGAGRPEQREELAVVDRQSTCRRPRRRRRTSCGRGPVGSRVPAATSRSLLSRFRLSPAPPVVAVQTVAPSPVSPLDRSRLCAFEHGRRRATAF